MNKFAPSLSSFLTYLDEEHASLNQKVEDLVAEYYKEFREAGVKPWRSFAPRNEKTRIRIDWRIHLQKKDGTEQKVQPKRVKLGTKYTQAPKFMGNLTGLHAELFHRYDPQLALMREQADIQADLRLMVQKALKRIQELDV